MEPRGTKLKHATVVSAEFCRFLTCQLLALSSPDAAPLDYGIWGFVESKARATLTRVLTPEGLRGEEWAACIGACP
ncbi:Hypothetical protein FKW44_023032 [Caligus rogercresseyi]|uniref:Uncharacterized protein n=1 Tax=Caligus rogercresseyi TaxID=217165 RepID=A0A7T8JV19_CALRO|nr:Hypothetical protein FKW44_023032 [Caligus rogercresseyi]